MPYTLNVFRKDLPLEKHLCANIKSATLLYGKQTIFLNFESQMKSFGISLAAYEKPLQLKARLRMIREFGLSSVVLVGWIESQDWHMY